MGRINGMGDTRRRWRRGGGHSGAARLWRVAPALGLLIIAGAFAVGSGARAERTAAATAPTLEELLRQRDGLQPGGNAPAIPARDRLRGGYDELRRRRADIADHLPPALRTPQPRRPELRNPPRDVTGREAVVAVDAEPANPDRVSFEVKP